MKNKYIVKIDVLDADFKGSKVLYIQDYAPLLITVKERSAYIFTNKKTAAHYASRCRYYCIGAKSKSTIIKL